MKIKRYLLMFSIILTMVNCQNKKEGASRRTLSETTLKKTKVKLEYNGHYFRDLNSNGILDVYEDINQPIEARINDLLAQMTLAEKAGMMFINGAPVNEDASLEKKEGAKGPAALMASAIDNISHLKMTHFNLWDIPANPGILAKWYNNFKGKEKDKIINLLNTVPTIVDIYLGRPAVIPEIAGKAKALIADFGASDKSVCEVLFGNIEPKGRLPFELPSSMEAVLNQKADVPYDSEEPLFKFGFGIKYRK